MAAHRQTRQLTAASRKRPRLTVSCAAIAYLLYPRPLYNKRTISFYNSKTRTNTNRKAVSESS